MIDVLSFFRFRFGCVVILQTTIDAYCQRRAVREDEAARAFHRRALVHRFRQLLSDPRRRRRARLGKRRADPGSRSINLQARSLQNEARVVAMKRQPIAAQTKWSMK
jgi:hypothetical protein